MAHMDYQQSRGSKTAFRKDGASVAAITGWLCGCPHMGSMFSEYANSSSDMASTCNRSQSVGNAASSRVRHPAKTACGLDRRRSDLYVTILK